MNHLAMFFYLFFGIVQQVFIPGFPKELLLLQAGAAFGLVGGTLLNWVAMITGAQLAYETTYYLSSHASRHIDRFTKLLTPKWHRKLLEQGNKGLFFIRLLPTAPNDVLSFTAGLLELPRKGFFIVSVLTAFPYALLFAYLAVQTLNAYQFELLCINMILFAGGLLIILGRFVWSKLSVAMDVKNTELLK